MKNEQQIVNLLLFL